MAQAKPQLGKDSVGVDPKHYTIELENDRVRILRARYGPRERSVMHTHPALVAIAITDASFRMIRPDGTAEERTMRAGQTFFADAEEHLPENLSDHAVEIVLIEMKQ